MKKLFTMIAVCGATLAMFTASAGNPYHAEKTHLSQTTISQILGQGNSSLRSPSCAQVSNLNFNTADSNASIYSNSQGYLSGNDSLNFGGTPVPTVSLGEKFEAPAGVGRYVSQALVAFGVVVINKNHADSASLITAYVYDTTGTSVVNGYAPGHAIDSGSVTLGSIAGDTLTGTTFTFSHNTPLPSSGFFITVSLPHTTGDTLVILTNDGTTGNGNGWAELSAAGQSEWETYDSLTGGQIGNLGNYIFPTVCGSACPTITVTATQIGTSSSAYATASGGVTPYLYAWSNHQTTDTATGLHSSTYTVTATDHNGCTGTGSVTIVTGIASIGNITDFNIYPNPSNGVFTASIHLATSSDVNTTVVDMVGNKVYESTDASVTELNKNINLSTIAPGLYIVNVKTAQGTANQRIIIR